MLADLHIKMSKNLSNPQAAGIDNINVKGRNHLYITRTHTLPVTSYEISFYNCMTRCDMLSNHLDFLTVSETRN